MVVPHEIQWLLHLSQNEFALVQGAGLTLISVSASRNNFLKVNLGELTSYLVCELKLESVVLHRLEPRFAGQVVKHFTWQR